MIQDSDAARRNLTVTSIGFLIYFWCGGSLENDSLKLPMISVEFSRPNVVALLSWVALIWFFYRYRLAHKSKFKEKFEYELRANPYMEMANEYAKEYKNITGVGIGEKGHHLSRLYWNWSLFDWRRAGFYADYVFGDNFSYEVERWREHGFKGRSKQNRTIKYSDWAGWKAAIQITGSCFYSHPGFADYGVPYLLFGLAVFSALVSFLFSIVNAIIF
jgi:hypothetical protein